MLLVRKVYFNRKLISKEILKHSLTKEDIFEITGEIASKFESRLYMSNTKFKNLNIDNYFDYLKISYDLLGLSSNEKIGKISIIFRGEKK